LQKKPTILLIIDNLNKGGAEMLLMGIIKDLQQTFKVVLVTLTQECYFDEIYFANVHRYCLRVKNKMSYPGAVIRLKKIINEERPAIVHAHLVYSSIIARLACPKNIPLIFSVHNEIGENVFKKSRILFFLEKLSVKSHHTLIAVSNAVLKDYDAFIPFAGKKYVLENYIGDEFFSGSNNAKIYTQGDNLKVVALGNVKYQKNYEYLVRSFIALKDYPVTLHIYGKQDEIIYPQLQTFIIEHNLPVEFKGIGSNIPQLLSAYHLYVMSSLHEGFGIAAVEAMACNLPLLLSDLDVLREITMNNAIFFDINGLEALAGCIIEIIEGKKNLQELSLKGLAIAKNYSKKQYLQKLLNIYKQVVPSL